MKYLIIVLIVLNAVAFGLLPSAAVEEKKAGVNLADAHNLQLLDEVVPSQLNKMLKSTPQAQLEEGVDKVASNNMPKELAVDNLYEDVDIVEVPIAEPVVLQRQYQCGLIAAFESVDEADKVVSALAQFDAKNVTVTVDENEVSNKYWVYLGPYRTEAEAREANARLRAKKRGGYVFSNDEVPNSISLGVFGSRENAVRLQAQLNGQGYRVKIWQQRLPVYAIKAEFPQNSPDLDAFIADKNATYSSCP